MSLTRRQFAAALALPALTFGADDSTVEVHPNPADPLLADPSVRWAIEDLKSALGSRLAQATPPRPSIRIAIGAPPSVVPRPQPPAESFRVAAPVANGIESSRQDIPTFNLTAADAPGLKFAVLEFADRIRHRSDWPQTHAEQPFLPVRGNMRLFSSEVEDKPWFYDRAMWPEYLSMLARIASIASTWPSESATISSARSPTPTASSPTRSSSTSPATKSAPAASPDSEPRQAISKRSATSASRPPPAACISNSASGCTVTSGTNSPHANYTIEGLTPETHAPYCRDALAPAPQGLPRHHRRHLPHPRRKRRRRRQLRFLEDVFDGSVAHRPQNRDRHARQGHG